jgi:Tfp pilus assembly protein PilO
MQAEKSMLSAKEKKLLGAAVVLGLFYLAFQFGFMPFFNEQKEKSEQYEELSERWRLVEIDLNREESVREDHDQAKAEYDVIRELFEQSDADTELSRMLTSIIQGSGLINPSQTLGNPVNFTVPGAEQIGESAFSTVTATMTFDGNYEQVKSLVDAIAGNKDISISQLSFSADSDRVSVTFVATLLNALKIDG